MGWTLYFENEERLAVADENGARVWFVKAEKETGNDYDGVGMNHLAVEVDSQADVDAAAGFLKSRGTNMLFGTPRHRPEFSQDDDHTYYQIMFESPDQLLFEVVYKGLKNKE